MSFESLVAKRYLKIKHQGKLVPLITVLATVGVGVGVMVLVVVIAVMTGFQSELQRRILGIESDMLVMRFNDWIAGYEQVVNKITLVKGVQSAAPFVYAQGMLRSATGVTGIVLRGIDPQRTSIQVGIQGGKTIRQVLGTGAEEATGKEPGLLLGAVMAEKLNVGVGDGVILMVVGNNQANPRVLPRMQHLKVVGLYETGMYQYDGAIGFLNIHDLQKMLDIPAIATGIEVRVADPYQVKAISRNILAVLGQDYWASTWEQMHRNLFSMLNLQKLMMYVILTLIIVVAAFNIASALIMMVKEKIRDIAIMKTMGASNRSFQYIFLIKGMVIGIVGVCLGIIGGLILCFILAKYPFIELPGDVYFLTTLPVKVTLKDLLVIIFGTLAICFFASLYPAQQAAKMKPVDGIRYG